MDIKRPSPPNHILSISNLKRPLFIPAPEIINWIRLTFFNTDSPLYNEDHEILKKAYIGSLWTNVYNGRGGKRVLAQAEIFHADGNKWAVARQEYLLETWFSKMPDFILTFDAHYMSKAQDGNFCAIVEHELYHCAQKRDSFGLPKFSRKTGKPIWGIRGHSVEEFTEVVARYGLSNVSPEISDFVESANRKPILQADSIAQACGTCLRVVG